MRINITAWCTYKEFYSLEITDSYVANLNAWFHGRYPDAEVSITKEDINAIFGNGEWDDKLNYQLDECYKLSNFIEEYVRDDVWESFVDNEYWSMDDWSTEIEFDSAAEKEHFDGPDLY